MHRALRQPAGWLLVVGLLSVWPTQGEVVLRALDAELKRGPNLLTNSGFEQAEGGLPNGWAPQLAKSAQLDRTGAHGGQSCLRLDKPDSGTRYWFSQTVQFKEPLAAPLAVSGWCRTQDVSGTNSADLSVWVDLQYVDGTPLYGQRALFDVGTHDWQYRELVFAVAKPVKLATVHVLFRGSYTGRAWFDDIALQPIEAPGGGMFDGGAVATAPGARPSPRDGATVLATTDGLQLAVGANGGLADLSVDQASLAGTVPGGFWVRDMAAKGPWLRFTGATRRDGDAVVVTGREESAGLALEARLEPRGNRLDGQATVRDTAGRDRAVTLCFVVPVANAGWRWQDDIVRSMPVVAGAEYRNAQSWPAAGASSAYPLASITNDRCGLSLAVPMDCPRVARMVYNASYGAYYLACDFGLAAEPVKYPRSADMRFSLYRHAPEWGFRAAVQGYQERFPQYFTQRLKRGGIWMAFADISKVTDWQDFGFAYDELGGKYAAFDDQHDIASFTYVEPMTYWLSMAKQYARTYDGAMQALSDNERSGKADLVRWAQVTRRSGVFTRAGRFDLSIENQSWCDGAVFTLNPDPNLPEDAACPQNKAHLGYSKAWADRNLLQKTGGCIDGMYLDSMPNWGEVRNWRREHWRTVEVPLTFDAETREPVLLQIFSTWQFSKWVADDVHARGGVMHGNGGALWPYFPALLDVTGQESRGPLSDEAMVRARTLLGNKPYSPLLNTRFDGLGAEVVEDYFNRSLLYGIFPSFFDGCYQKDGAWVHVHYFKEPAFYNRDRHLFKRYIPILRAMFDAGWKPVTYARTEPTAVRVERYGPAADGAVYLAVFNPTKAPVDTVVRADAARLGLAAERCAARLMVADRDLPVRAQGAQAAVTVSLGANKSEVVKLVAARR